MGAMDKINEMKDKAMDKAKEAMSGDHKDEKIDKAAEMADDKTAKKHTDEINKAAQAAKDKTGDKK
jgi:MT0933-like antitoxin protein